MKTLTLVLTAALSALGLAACSSDSGDATTSGGGSGGSSGDGGSNNGSGGDNTSPSSGNPTSGSTSGNTVSSGEGGGPSVGSTGEGAAGGGGVGGGIDCGDEPFLCGDGSCIPVEYLCDQYVDCEDESDEYPINEACEAPPEVPADWICDPAFYGVDDGCDCGCGVVDLDCPDATDASCEYCVDPSCAMDGSEEFTCDLDALVDDDNSQCL